MTVERTLAVFVGGIFLSAASQAQQPEVHLPDFSVTLHAQVMTLAESPSMAADRFGNVYIRSQSSILSTSGVVHKVDSDGNAPYTWFVSGLGRLSEIACSPVDGLCYVAAHDPSVTPAFSTIYRIDPNAGAVAVGAIDLAVQGFTIDDAGLVYVGTAAGLYVHDPAGPAGNATFVSSGHAANAILQSLISGDVLVAGGVEVRRWSPGSASTVPYYLDPEPTGYSMIQALARGPFNETGAGALIGVRDIDTSCLCANGRTVAVDLAGNVLAFATEPFADFCENGLKAIASGPRQDQWWLTDHSLPTGGPMPLYRIRQLPAQGNSGSLFATVNGGSVTLDLFGPAAGGNAFLLGAVEAPAPLVAFVPSLGIVDLGPFHPSYVALVDGVGLFGAPNPAGETPPGGHFQVTAASPSALSGTSWNLQALILAPGSAPNGIFQASNVQGLTLP